MPTPLHAIVHDCEFEPARLARTLDAFRRYTGRALADLCATHRSPSFTRVLREQATQDRMRRFWQPSRHPVALSGRAFTETKINYIHDNPCRKGLVRYPEDWRYSSARYYATGKPEDSDVPITALEW